MTLESVLAIAGMIAVTYAIRAGGLFLADRLPETGFVAAWLKQVPGAVLAALVAPGVVAGGVAEWCAAVATALAFIATRSLLPSMAAGIAVVWVVRQLT
jgi:uncharacterized membrane protein